MTSLAEKKIEEKKASKAANPKGKKIRNAVLLGFLAVALGIGIPDWWYHHNHETTDDSQIEGHILQIMPRVGGYAERVNVVDEQKVNTGDTLFTLDKRELEIKVRQAEADLMAAEAAAKGGVAGAGAHVAEAQKTASQANLDAARANLEKAKKDVARVRELNKNEIASKSQLDAAEAALQASQAAFEAASEQARGSAFNILGANAQVRAADARLAAAAAALDAARLQLSYAVVLSPASGHIAKKNLEPGQLVSPGQPVMAVVDDSPMWVVANLKETQLAHLRVGQPAEIDVDAYPNLTLKGEIESIQYATGARFSLLPPENATGNFTKVVQRVPVRIKLVKDPDAGSKGTPNGQGDPADVLRPGMSVSVAIDIR